MIRFRWTEVGFPNDILNTGVIDRVKAAKDYSDLFVEEPFHFKSYSPNSTLALAFDGQDACEERPQTKNWGHKLIEDLAQPTLKDVRFTNLREVQSLLHDFKGALKASKRSSKLGFYHP